MIYVKIERERAHGFHQSLKNVNFGRRSLIIVSSVATIRGTVSHISITKSCSIYHLPKMKKK